MKRRGLWGVGFLVAALSAGAIALAAESPLRSRSFEIESRRGSSRLVLSNDEREAVWAAAEETGYTLNSIDLRSGRIRRVRDLVADRAQEESLLHPVPGRDGAYVFGVHCCSATNGWALWFVERGREVVELTREDGDGDLGDGSIVFSPSGRFFLAGTGFDCVGGGHSCSASTVTVFSARSGKAEFVTELPFEWDELEKDDQPSAANLRRYPLGEGPGWCAGDVLMVAGKDGRSQTFVRDRDGRWHSRAAVGACFGRSAPHWRGTWPELDGAYTLSGRQVEVHVRGSEDRKKVILEVSRIRPMR